MKSGSLIGKKVLDFACTTAVIEKELNVVCSLVGKGSYVKANKNKIPRLFQAFSILPIQFSPRGGGSILLLLLLYRHSVQIYRESDILTNGLPNIQRTTVGCTFAAQKVGKPEESVIVLKKSQHQDMEL